MADASGGSSRLWESCARREGGVKSGGRMANLKIRPSDARHSKGRTIHVTPASAGWTYVGFDLCRLKPGESARGSDREREVCLVLVSGRAAIGADGQYYGMIGERMSPFEGKPWSVYVPAGGDWMVTAATDVELAVCSSPGMPGSHAARVIAPEGLHQETRGKGSNVRHVTNILPEWEPADEPARRRGDHARRQHLLLSAAQARHRQSAARVAARGGLLPPPQPAAGLCLPARLHRRPLARRDDDGRGRRRDAGAARLSSLRGAARLRPLLSQRHGRPEAHLEIPQRAGARVAVEERERFSHGRGGAKRG